LVGERRDDAEVAAAASNPPEQVRVLIVCCTDDLAICQHDLRLDQVVAGKTVPPAQPAEAASQREAGDASRGLQAAWTGQPERLRHLVVLTPYNATLGHRNTPVKVDAHVFHPAQVDHERAVPDGEPGHVVASTAHGDGQVV